MSCARSAAAASSASRRRRQQSRGSNNLSTLGLSHRPAEEQPPTEIRTSAFVRRAFKEAALLGRRASYGWRHLHAGMLSFQSPDDGGARRTFAIGKKLGEGGCERLRLRIEAGLSLFLSSILREVACAD